MTQPRGRAALLSYFSGQQRRLATETLAPLASWTPPAAVEGIFALMESPTSPSRSGPESREPYKDDLECKGRRRKREFIPEDKKDDLYWEKRRKNNEAAKRSREKRKMNDHVLENHFEALKEENARLSAELMAIKVHFGLVYPLTYPQPNPLQHYARSSAPTNTHHQLFQRDHYWSGKDPAAVSSYPQSLFFPTYALHSYFNTPNTTAYGLLNPLVLPQHLMAAHPSAPLLKPVPSRATEEDEQQVPRPFSLPCSVPAIAANPRGDKKCSYMTNGEFRK
ncbi:nuclear factor, interleukin 3 regulated, member 4 [Takifugu rubripes]|uniref:nuclear factor, interleukin 3 regulated, member 4 n=1 Tax=Takifugu rubripes TaxID=31033 RepID=UPI0005D1C741|nr:uncharacterized protein LOC105417918 [Takifugu rubripes]|eukprot:XP_011612951.1 PREDICTED: uncharacterized protein LOC105417918 isoform X1 [Takifugu rubripes]